MTAAVIIPIVIGSVFAGLAVILLHPEQITLFGLHISLSDTPEARRRNDIFGAVLILAGVGSAIVMILANRSLRVRGETPPGPSSPVVEPTPASQSPMPGNSVQPSSSFESSSANPSAAPVSPSSDVVSYLSLLTPAQNEASGYGTVPNGDAQIGSTTYPNSAGFFCGMGFRSYVVYDVAGFKFLSATVGVPSDATYGAGNALVVTFFKDGGKTPLASPITVTLDHSQSIHLDLQGTSQLEVACTGHADTGYAPIVLGSATLGSS